MISLGLARALVALTLALAGVMVAIPYC